MRIAISGSLQFYKEMAEAKLKLEALGHEVRLPPTAEKLLAGLVSDCQIASEKGSLAFAQRIVQEDAIKRYHQVISECDAILVMNIGKKGISDYIGGATFLEMGFAHVMDKKIFLLNNIPEMNYSDEIRGMQPLCLNGDLKKIRQPQENIYKHSMHHLDLC